MKAVELNNSQKLKLLEMCKILFPDYKIRFNNIPSDFNIRFSNISSDFKHINKLNILIIAKSDKAESSEAIDWFEFCYTYLLYKLSYRLYSKNIETLYKRSNNIWYEYHHIVNDYIFKGKNLHPIEFLYQEFQKLN